MILVLTGTHEQPFDRLVRAADALAAAGDEVVVQAGASEVALEHATGRPWYRPSQLEQLAAASEVVIAHAGPGSLALARRAGRWPVVVPRSARHGEHVDDHQIHFADRLTPVFPVVFDPTDLDALQRAVIRARRGEPVTPHGRGPAPGAPGADVIERVSARLAQVASRPRRRGVRLRATVALARWLSSQDR